MGVLRRLRGRGIWRLFRFKGISAEMHDIKCELRERIKNEWQACGLVLVRFLFSAYADGNDCGIAFMLAIHFSSARVSSHRYNLHSHNFLKAMDF